jgi:hypothetical protein
VDVLGRAVLTAAGPGDEAVAAGEVGGGAALVKGDGRGGAVGGEDGDASPASLVDGAGEPDEVVADGALIGDPVGVSEVLGVDDAGFAPAVWDDAELGDVLGRGRRGGDVGGADVERADEVDAVGADGGQPGVFEEDG